MSRYEMVQPEVSMSASMEMPLGTWTVDLRTQRCFVDSKLSWLFGLNDDQVKDGVSADRLMDVVLLPDREDMLKQWEAAMTTGSLYDIQCRIRTPDGVFQPIRSIGACHRDESGTPYLFSGHIIALPAPYGNAAAALVVDSLIARAQTLAKSRRHDMVVYLLEMARLENRGGPRSESASDSGAGGAALH